MYLIHIYNSKCKTRSFYQLDHHVDNNYYLTEHANFVTLKNKLFVNSTLMFFLIHKTIDIMNFKTMFVSIHLK